MSRYHNALIQIPIGVDITDADALKTQFAALVEAATGAPNDALAATFADGFHGLIDTLVDSFVSTTGYQATGTQPVAGMYLVHVATSVKGSVFDFLCFLYQQLGQNWTLVAHQPYDKVHAGETTDEDGNPVPVYAVQPYRALTQAVLPYLTPDDDGEGNLTPKSVVEPHSIGVFAGSEPWVIA